MKLCTSSLGKRISFAVFGLLFFSAGLWAEIPAGDIFNHPLKPQTLDAFKKTCAVLAECPFIKGNFEQEKILSRLGRSVKSGGIFIIAAEYGMVWETIKPYPSTLVLGKDYLIQSRPGGQKTVMSAQGNETFLRLAEVISAVFSGNAQGLLDNFDVYYTVRTTGSGAGSAAVGNIAGSNATANNPAWELGLSPLDKAISSFAARISMSGDSAIRFIMINEQNGDAINYILSNHNFPPELHANEKALFALP